MGRYTLFLVLAAVVGGSYLSYSLLRTRAETGDRRAGSQAATLARQLAESGQAIGLTAITKADGFDKGGGGVFSGGKREHRGGTIGFDTLDTQDFPDGRQRATIRVSGVVAGPYGVATHRLRSVYDFDPMDFPGPVWLDVPYATAKIKGATIDGVGPSTQPQIDPRKNNDLNLASDGFTFDQARQQFAGAGASVGSWDVGGDSDNNDGRGRTRDLRGDVPADQNRYSTADDLYYQLSNAATKTYDGPRTLSGAVGAPDAITLVRGDVTVTGSVRGQGALVVEGDLRVPGTMDWTGLVVVRSEEQHAVVDLGGSVRITGALVVSQEAYPPGGHLDLTVFRAPEGSWPVAWGRREGGPSAGLQPSPNWSLSQPFRWFEHTHRFDQPADGNADRAAGLVRFVDRPAGDPQDRYTALRDLLQHLGSTRVRVEFARAGSAHGHAVYEMEVAGQGGVVGTVARGFDGTALAGPSEYRSASFAAQDLRRLTVRPRARRSLRKLWDGSGNCDGGLWPYCVGEDRWGRRGALGVRVVGADNGKLYYEGTLYWHMQEGAEQDQHAADLAAWRDGVASGATPFGTDLTMSSRVNVTYALAPIVALAERAGFRGNRVIHISTESDLTEAVETRAAARAAADRGAQPPVPARPPMPTAPDGQVFMCDKRGQTKTVAEVDVARHLGHGCTVGACRAPDDPRIDEVVTFNPPPP